jgi:nitroreductase
MLTLAALNSRRSTPTRQLTSPGPSPEQLERILQTAVRVPDHGKRVPFRFLTIQHAARLALADAAEARLRQREPNPDPAIVDKLRTRFIAPPLTIAVIAHQGDDAKIPASERFATASCVCLLLLQAAQAEGFGAQWLTGWLTHDRDFLEQTLRLSPDEVLVGTLAIGSTNTQPTERERPDIHTLLSDWQP